MRRHGKQIQVFLVLTGLMLGYSPALTLATDKESIKPWARETPVRSSWLHEHLPADALAYVRIPHPLGFLAMPKGSALDSALRSTGNIESSTTLHRALLENVLEYVPGFEEEFVRKLAQQLRSPIEIAVTLSPAPSMTLAMNLEANSAAAFQQTIESVSFGGGTLSLLEQLDSDGFGQIMGLPMPTSVYFDEASGLVLMQTGPSVSAQDFATTVQLMDAPVAHRMHLMEERIDTSGHGFFVWIDAENALPAAQMFADQEQIASLQESGLDKVRAVAFGWGAAQGKGRMSLILDMDRSGDRQFLPYVSNELTATSVGEPDAILSLSIPTVEEFSRIESLALDIAEEDDRNTWLEGKQKFESELGMSVENVLSAFGPEVIGIFDQAGDYMAVRLRDEALFDQLVENLFNERPVERRYKRRTFYHASIAEEITSLDGEDVETFGPLGFLIARQSEHVHWYRDGDFLYMASLPQPLIDRLDAGPDTRIDRWLSEQQRFSLGDSIIGMTGTSDKLPRRIYYLYIEMLQALADISEADFDVWSMPTAAQAQLPDKGTLGLSFDLGDPFVSVNLVFENNPLESIFSGDTTSIAALGIIAAIAIPAYQDYMVRAQVSNGLMAAAPAKIAIAEHFAAEGSFPGPSAAANIGDSIPLGDGIESIEVIAGSGMIVVSFTPDAGTDGGQLFLKPVAQDSDLEWTCSSPIPDDQLPAVCRGNAPPELEQTGT